MLAAAEEAGDGADMGVKKISDLEDVVSTLSAKLTEDEVADLEQPYVPHSIVGHQERRSSQYV